MRCEMGSRALGGDGENWPTHATPSPLENPQLVIRRASELLLEFGVKGFRGIYSLELGTSGADCGEPVSRPCSFVGSGGAGRISTFNRSRRFLSNSVSGAGM